ncbi:MAG: M28 family peptidase [Gemmatimonadaceae bacterium]|nr:M28 family peptidase [Gemmatimonadaceae bacterium]
MKPSHFIVPALVCCAVVGSAQTATHSVAVPAAISAIREADIKRDLYQLASDAMRGREAGTLDELRASVWVSEQMQKIGLKPLGDFGSWFQWWNMRRTRISTPNSSVTLAGKPLTLWSDVTPVTNVNAELSAPTVFGSASDTTLDIRGKVAIVQIVAPPAAQVRSTTNTYEYNYTRAAIVDQGNKLISRGAAGVIFVADSIAEIAFNGLGVIQSRGAYTVVDGAPLVTGRTPNPNALTTLRQPTTQIPLFIVHGSALADWRKDGQAVTVSIRSESFDYPSNNVIGVVRGTDPKLRDEYVLFSAHTDHDGVRYPLAGDSIWNGADDNASTSAAVLAIARAFVQHPAKRSALFIINGAEERGLLGSRYHAAHPVVPITSIAAVLNGDMIGRNNRDTAGLLGSQPPHRNSMQLVQMAFDANNATGKFAIDSTWDRPTHPEGFYFRSDHLWYASLKIPTIYFTTELHSDYHTPRDEASRIDYAKLTHMAKWIYMTGWLAANAPVRPALDPGFVLH